MFSLRRFCIGAALGLSLLACGPAHAKTYLPLKNPLFTHVSSGAKTAHNPTGVTGWNIFANGVNLAYGSAFWTPLASGFIYKSLSGTLTKSVTFTLTGRALITKTTSNYSLYASLRWFTPAGSPSTITRNFDGSFSVKFPVSAGARLTDFRVYGRKAHLYSLDPGAAPAPAAPEVDPRAGAPALALTLGGLALMEERRRRKQAGKEDASAMA